jgi:hypothetical protein
MDINELEYSNDALDARADMKDPDVSEIFVFVEDINKEFFYEKIFDRLFDNENMLLKPIGLGGKNKVISRFNENKEKGENDYFYLVDGDFDRYIGIELIEDDRFIYLEAYNIENYIIDENVVYNFLTGKLKKTKREVRKLFNFNQWKDKIVYESKKLFLCYAFIQCYLLNIEDSEIIIDKKYNAKGKSFLSIENVSRSPFEFLNPYTGYEQVGNFDKYYREVVLRLCIENGFENFSGIEVIKCDKLIKSYSKVYHFYNSSIDSISEKYELINGTNYYNFICGKFLITSLKLCIKEVLKRQNLSTNFDERDFENQLSSYFDIDKLSYVKNKIEKI